MITMRTAKRVMPRAKTKESNPAQKGAVFVEFAAVLPVFLALVFMMITAAVALYDKTVLTMATAAAARAGAKFVPGQMTSGYVISRANTAFTTACGSNLVSFSGPFTTTVTPQVLTGPSRVLVTASMPYVGVGYPIVTSLTISSSATMMLEQ